MLSRMRLACHDHDYDHHPFRIDCCICEEDTGTRFRAKTEL